MAVTNTPIFPQLPTSWGAILTSSSSITVPTALVPTTTNGARVDSLIVTTTNSAGALTFQLYKTVGSNQLLYATINIPLSSGSTTAALPINILSPALIPGLPVDGPGNPYIDLAPSDSLQIMVTAAPASGKFLYAIATGGIF